MLDFPVILFSYGLLALGEPRNVVRLAEPLRAVVDMATDLVATIAGSLPVPTRISYARSDRGDAGPDASFSSL
jgi:hypothetical protein